MCVCGVRACVRACVRLCACMHAYVCVWCACACMRVCICACVHMCVRAYVHVCVHARMYVYVHVCVCWQIKHVDRNIKYLTII